MLSIHHGKFQRANTATNHSSSTLTTLVAFQSRHCDSSCISGHDLKRDFNLHNVNHYGFLLVFKSGHWWHEHCNTLWSTAERAHRRRKWITGWWTITTARGWRQDIFHQNSSCWSLLETWYEIKQWLNKNGRAGSVTVFRHLVAFGLNSQQLPWVEYHEWR